MPDFKRFKNVYRDQLNIVIVDNFEKEALTAEEILEWYDGENYTMPFAFDFDHAKTEEFYTRIQGYPTTFIYDQEGNYIRMIIGAIDYKGLEEIMMQHGLEKK